MICAYRDHSASHVHIIRPRLLELEQVIDSGQSSSLSLSISLSASDLACVR
jgi:hypothetical protein